MGFWLLLLKRKYIDYLGFRMEVAMGQAVFVSEEEVGPD